MAYTNKIILINGTQVYYVNTSLKTQGGYPETVQRVQISGNSVDVQSYDKLETAIAKVSFDILVSDSDNDSDPRQFIKSIKANKGNNQIVIQPDGVGKTQLYKNASLMSDPEINENPDGTISLAFESRPMILVD